MSNATHTCTGAVNPMAPYTPCEGCQELFEARVKEEAIGEVKWDRRSAITALLQIAEDALRSAAVVAPDNSPIKDRVHEARARAKEAHDLAVALDR